MIGPVRPVTIVNDRIKNKSSKQRLDKTNKKVKRGEAVKIRGPVDNSKPLSDARKQAIADQQLAYRIWRFAKVGIVSLIIIAAAYYGYQYFFADGYDWSGIHPENLAYPTE